MKISDNATINERVLKLRSTLGLSAEKFGARIGVSRSAICKIEKNNVNITEQMQKSICREFNVNEEWLKYGTGEMFYAISNLVDNLLPHTDDCTKETIFTLGYLAQQFTAEEWTTIWKFLNIIAGKDK